MFKENYEKYLSLLDKACQNAGRKIEEIQTIAVSKFFPVEDIQSAIACGIKDFGENRADEMRQKAQEIGAGIRWHFIGQLQTNKVKYIINDVSLCQSVDRIALAQELDKRCGMVNRNLDILVQVAENQTQTRGGIELETVEPLFDFCQQSKHLKVRGLMCVAPLGLEEAQTRDFFRRVYEKYTALNGFLMDDQKMSILSMGMSGDFPLAIKEGSNMVRIGSLLFGKRNY